ncbi:MAG: DUF1992 domain-containing protein [Betaproteobacteria bacterium]|jgi:hypothetical protein|nr:DUF1992 domain-containing protein [Betaproteobacteria bacterium]OZB65836.1 MAG: molecular chaperone DnaJ [Thiomonas sp. 13-66-29]
MNALAWIGETRIAQAIQDGAFDHLPGAGRPLDVQPRDALLDAQSRLALDLLERAGKLRGTSAERQRERMQLRLLWAAALTRRTEASGRRRVPRQDAQP